MSISLVLTKIHCVVPSEPGHDELFFTYKIDGGDEIRHPAEGYHAIAANEDWPVDLPLKFNNTLEVTLWDDDDWPNADDYLGRATYTPGNLPHKTAVSGNTGQYDVYIITQATDEA